MQQRASRLALYQLVSDTPMPRRRGAERDDVWQNLSPEVREERAAAFRPAVAVAHHMESPSARAPLSRGPSISSVVSQAKPVSVKPAAKPGVAVPASGRAGSRPLLVIGDECSPQPGGAPSMLSPRLKSLGRADELWSPQGGAGVISPPSKH